MSENDHQVPSALVAVAAKALAVRSETLIKRGLALAASLQPGDADAHYNLGNALYHKGDLVGAIAEYREALRLNPNNDLAHIGIGIALHHKGDMEGAIAEYRKAYDLKPLDHTTCFILTGALRRQGQYEAASRVIEPYLAKCRAASLENPDDSAKHAVLGQALHFNGDLEGAISEFRRALRLRPHSFSLHQFLRDLLVQKGEFPEAIAESREIVRIRHDAWA